MLVSIVCSVYDPRRTQRQETVKEVLPLPESSPQVQLESRATVISPTQLMSAVAAENAAASAALADANKGLEEGDLRIKKRVVKHYACSFTHARIMEIIPRSFLGFRGEASGRASLRRLYAEFTGDPIRKHNFQ